MIMPTPTRPRAGSVVPFLLRKRRVGVGTLVLVSVAVLMAGIIIGEGIMAEFDRAEIAHLRKVANESIEVAWGYHCATMSFRNVKDPRCEWEDK